VERNRLALQQGRVAATGTGDYELIDATLVFRSIGYFGTPLSGVPFDDRLGVISNEHGRVTAGRGGAVIPRLYAAGWIKRGPVGLIGTNKADAKETVDQMLADLDAAPIHHASAPDQVLRLLRDRGVRLVSQADWRRLDALEVMNGEKRGKVREKFTTTESMLRALEASTERTTPSAS